MGFGGAEHKSFFTYEEAMQYMGRRSRRSEARGGNGGGGVAGARDESLEGHFSRCRVTTWRGGDPGSGSSSAMEAYEGGFSACRHGMTGMVMFSVGVAMVLTDWNYPDVQAWWEIHPRYRPNASATLNVFWEWHAKAWIEPSQGKELFGYAVILPESERGLEVVEYRPVDVDEGTATMDAVELMMQRVLAATREKITMLEAECAEMK
ncbi:hypothetical protein PIB30_083045 [Stylosanthes scabra]|uniref:Uncharacterized protein n=1 Tax=Stylosanthes scabra TaxID=79078 RepID=A0ABU6QUJ4_9FABA|nr:hypothetical protein [Stylosanthes scabra]